MNQFVTDLLGKYVKATKIDGASWSISTARVCPNDVIGYIRLITPDFVFVIEDRDHRLQVVLLGSHLIEVLP